MELLRLQPTQGSTRGGDLVQLQGFGFSAHSQVLFDSLPATVIGVAADGSSIDVRTPEHQAGLVNVTVTGQQSQVMKVAAFAFLRPQLTQESDLTRLVRVLIQSLKRQVLQNTGISMSIDYRGMTHDSVHVVELAHLPALVLTGPRMRENKLFANPQLQECSAGHETIYFRSAYTVDLFFTLTGASQSTGELLNMMAAAASYLHLNRWINLPRQSGDPSELRWEMDPEGEFHTQLDGVDDVRAFTCSFVVRGFDIDAGVAFEPGRDSDAIAVHTHPMENLS